VWGLFGNPFLMLIALFVWMGAVQEASMVQMRAALAGIPVARAMITHFHTLQPDEPVSRAAELVLAGFQHDFPVVEEGELVGIVTRQDLAAALAGNNPHIPVRQIMQRDFVTVSPRDMLYSAFNRLQECNCHTLPVVENGQLVGILTADNLAEVLMSQEAARQAPRNRPGEVAGAPARSPSATAFGAEARSTNR
jgi:CBS domain-containing protein